ncbi:hypothetical protein D082_30750 [Synechocystis sp. PCC 6714]|nr:hypothetical protein D082_30750 [Synechocystis sp. PCC 6714]
MPLKFSQTNSHQSLNLVPLIPSTTTIPARPSNSFQRAFSTLGWPRATNTPGLAQISGLPSTGY